MSDMAKSTGPLLRIEAGGHAWGIPFEAVERVGRPADSPVDRDGAQALIHDDLGPVPLLSLGGPLALGARQRILWLRDEEDRIAVVADAIGGQLDPADFHPLPSLPFRDPPPILGLVGDGESALPVLDLKRLSSPLPPLPRAPSPWKEAAGPQDGPDPSLMLLPSQGPVGGDVPLIPAISAAQVLGIEGAGPVTPLPSLPAWCLGIGWWRGAPVGVYDLAGRLSPEPDHAPARGGRWLIAAVPGGGRVAIELDGRCSAALLPERATVEPAQGALADAVYGLFRTEDSRLALLDLERWQRSTG